MLAVKNNAAVRPTSGAWTRRRWRRGGLPRSIDDECCKGLSLVMEAKGHASTIGVGCQYDSSRVGGIGCWCGRSIADPEDLAY